LAQRLVKKDKYRIVLLTNLREDSIRNLQLVSRKLNKGFIRNGHDVQVFSYLQQMNALSSLPGKILTKKFTQNRTDKLCCDLLRDYQPDLVLLLAYRVINHETIAQLREALPGAFFAGWYPDQLDGMTDDFIRTNQLLDAFMATGAGEPLAQVAKKSNDIPSAFIANPCDPDIEKPYPNSHMPETNILFPGKFSHKYYTHDGNREPLLKLLAKNYGLMNYGNGINPSIWGMDYYGAISKTKIALAININNNFRMYHSDRLINYLGCGAFVLAKYVPDSELLFEDHKHLRYFNTEDQCLDLIDYYLKNEDERARIASAGMMHAHEVFNCQRIARDIIDFLTTGTYDEPWRDIVNYDDSTDKTSLFKQQKQLG